MIQATDFRLQTPEKNEPAACEAANYLFQTLNQHGVRYCHWKSNQRLLRGLRGEADLDLLVDPGHSRIFKQFLKEHQVIPALAPPGKRYPAIEDYLGFDPASGTLLHLHVHYQLVLGEQFVKNYHLPLEDWFLSSVRLQCGVKIPSPEVELIVLSIRALLKYRDRDAVKDRLSIRSPGIPAHILAEIHWLLEQTSIHNVSEALVDISDIIPPEIIIEFLNTVVVSPRAGRELYRLRQRIRRVLRVYQRRSRLQASLRYFQETWRRRSFLKFGPARSMTLPTGLAMALIGVDGSGKTTLSKELNRWLGSKLDVQPYYLGSKQPSRPSRWLYLFFRMTRRSHRALSGRLGEKNILSRLIAAIRETLLYGHHLSTGFDRYRRHLAARRATRRGSIVIYDRFPLAASLDGPLIHLIAAEKNGRIGGAFSSWEQQIYRSFQAPDLAFILDVSPEVSLQRKPDHPREVIEAKNRALSELTTGNGANAKTFHGIRINADQPLDEVLLRLKQEIWESILHAG